MIKETLNINGIPAVLYGSKSRNVYIFVHGKCGCKEEAADFAVYACPAGFQVLAFDLPGHGERKSEPEKFNPWDVYPEFVAVLNYAKEHWSNISLRANSIGALFSMMSYTDESFDKCLFVSPITDMEKLIINMMRYANVSEQELREKKEISTDFGEVLSIKYLDYVRAHHINEWNSPTAVLYAENDNLTDHATIDEFVSKTHSTLYVMKNGEHWFHTEEQLRVLNQWTKTELV